VFFGLPLNHKSVAPVGNTMDWLRVNLGIRIQKLREAKGLTLPQLSHISGIDEEELKNLESLENNFAIGTLFTLAPILDFNAARLMQQCAEDTTVQQHYSVIRQEQ
jgi:transcriptional regulator with XRE-family HTH domain